MTNAAVVHIRDDIARIRPTAACTMRGMDFLAWMAIIGGVCTVGAAREHLTARELRCLRDEGALWTPLRGWLALADCNSDAVRALELGGVATCVSALREHELWTPHGQHKLHIRVRRNTHGTRVVRTGARDDVIIHRLHVRLKEEVPWTGVDDVPTTLAVASGCVSADNLVAAADTALACGKIQAASLLEMSASLPRRRRRLFERASALSGSGTESTFAAMLRRARIAFAQQPELLPGEFFDFLIGRSLVIEIDSLEWHGTREQMLKDRVRDAKLTALGYRVVRFTYEQVMFEPEHVLRTVLDLVRRGVHQRALLREAA